MAKFTSETPKIKFIVPDDVTVEKQLEFSSLITSFDKKNRLKNMWRAALVVIEDWECKLIPVLDEAELSEMTNPDQALVIAWVGSQVWDHMNSLEEIPKN